jgi:hypothetical protein
VQLIRRSRRWIAWGIAAALGGSASAALGDGSVTIRNAYYKEEATRVIQPMLDARLEADEATEITAHILVDSISSASVAAGASGEAFNESRVEGGLGFAYAVDAYRFGLSGRYSEEPDYKSLFGSVRAERDFAERNTTVGLTIAAGTDELDNSGAQNPMSVELLRGELKTLLASASLSQALSPVLVGSLTYDISRLDGFQENPYRQVIAGGIPAAERVPDTRLRHAVFGSLRGFHVATELAVMLGYRFYIDDWGIVAHTPEVRAIKTLAAGVTAHARYRYHRQGAADFFKDVYDTADPMVEPFITDDVKLSAFTTHTLGVKLESALGVLGAQGWLARARADVVFEYTIQNNRFGNAVAGQLALTIPFEY